MRLVAALYVSSFVVLAQTPPADVDAALRARVNEFFGYHVSGEFQKAWPMVAADTKDEYFSAQKTRYERFKIDSIKYSPDFTQAVVTLTVVEKKRMSVQFPEVELTHPSSTQWKIENGVWCWYTDHKTNWLMPMGPSDVESMQKRADAASSPVPSPDKMKNLVQGILTQSSLNKTEMRLASNKASEDQAVFHNGQGGQIKLSLLQANLPSGMTAKLDKSDLNANEDALLKVNYKPEKGAAIPNDVTLSIAMEPFNRVFSVTVRFAPAP